jgi:hypothetical protein
VIQRIRADVTPPLPRFAPPIERSPTIKAVVGKRFYYRVDPTSFSEYPIHYGWDYYGNPVSAGSSNERWVADVLFIPLAMTLKLPDGELTCDGPGFDATNQAGRDAANDAGCFDIINDRPPGGSFPSQVTTTWLLVVNSNIPGVPTEFNHEESLNVEVRVKEIQAVIVASK